ncbi:MAG: hypothetical protein AAFP92_08420 [Bacteroidota bacterium]
MLHISGQTLDNVFALGNTFSERPQDVMLDGSGNYYVTGAFQGTIDMDPGAGTTNLTSVGGSDIFLAKFTLTGKLLWAIGLGSSGSEISYRLALDPSGHVYITGSFSGTVDFDPGPSVKSLTSAGGTDVFVAKYTPAGVYEWANAVASTANNIGYGLDVNASGRVVITGYFGGTADIEPGPGIQNLVSAGTQDIFVVVYQDDGSLIYGYAVGSTGFESGYGIAMDDVGNIYLSGNFIGTLDFDPGLGVTSLTSQGFSGDAFIAKYDDAGDFVWVHALSSSGFFPNIAYDLLLNDNGDLCVTGYFYGTVDFDPGPGTASITAGGALAVFFARYAPDQTFKLAFQLEPTSINGATQTLSLATDPNNNIYLSGNLQGTADFDPSGGVASRTATSGADGFLAKYDENGLFEWVYTIAGSGQDYVTAMAADVDNRVAVGYFTGTTNFDPNGTANLTANGSNDMFFALYTDPVTLPVNWEYWEARQRRDGIYLDWGVNQATQLAGFTVQRSTDGLFFQDLTFVPGTANQQATQSFSYIDHPPHTGVYHYRLKQLDLDGKFEFSELKTLSWDPTMLQVQVSPNPFSDQLHLEFPGEDDHPGTYTIRDFSGRQILSGIWQPLQALKIPTAEWPSGLYWLDWENQNRKHHQLIEKR